jgi:hypothetical protein
MSARELKYIPLTGLHHLEYYRPIYDLERRVVQIDNSELQHWTKLSSSFFIKNKLNHFSLDVSFVAYDDQEIARSAYDQVATLQFLRNCAFLQTIQSSL